MMTGKYFTLDDGTLELSNDRILICDKAKKRILSERFLIITGIVLGISNITKGANKNDYFDLYFGIGLIVVYIIAIIYTKKFKNIADKEIFFKDIADIRITTNWVDKARFGNIITKQNKIRRFMIDKRYNNDFEIEDAIRKMIIF